MFDLVRFHYRDKRPRALDKGMREGLLDMTDSRDLTRYSAAPVRHPFCIFSV
jgi:hypothetical protein